MENLYYKHQNVLGHGELEQTGAYPFWCITADVSVAYHLGILAQLCCDMPS